MRKRTSKQTTSSKTTTKHEDRNSYLQKNPMWKFQRADKEHAKWSVRNCRDFCTEILEKLVDFEGQTWCEIKGRNNHFINVSSMTKGAQNRLKELRIIEDELFSLRLNGKCRLFGILDDGVFYIVWYDFAHEICPSQLKHT